MLELPRNFSRRNGFGPIPRPPAGMTQYELDQLLDSMTPAEEAAIRMVTPVLSIVSLRYGNIASKGNTTCVRQKSWMQGILPNLPTECRVKMRKSRRPGSHKPGLCNAHWYFCQHAFHPVRLGNDLSICFSSCEAGR